MSAAPDDLRGLVPWSVVALVIVALILGITLMAQIANGQEQQQGPTLAQAARATADNLSQLAATAAQVARAAEQHEAEDAQRNAVIQRLCDALVSVTETEDCNAALELAEASESEE